MGVRENACPRLHCSVPSGRLYVSKRYGTAWEIHFLAWQKTSMLIVCRRGAFVYELRVGEDGFET